MTLAGPGWGAQGGAEYRGRPVQQVIEELREAGAPVVYSSNLVSPDARVAEEPAATEPLALLREILAPHALTIQEADGAWLVVRDATVSRPPPPGALSVHVVDEATSAPVPGAVVLLDAPSGPSERAGDGSASFESVLAGRHLVTVDAPGYLRGRLAVDVPPGTPQTVTLSLARAAPRLEELTVTASRYDLVDDVGRSSAVFTREEIENLSDLGDDPVRVTHRLPGLAASEFSARPYVRGGDSNEMAIFFEGLELVEPFHLRDFEAPLSTIDPRVVSGIQIYSGGFPAAYGGALSGLTVIDGREPAEPLRHELGVSLLHTSLLSSGTFGGGRGEWLASVRRGNVDELLEDDRGEPRYHDAYAHLAWRLGRHKLALNALNYDDDILLIAAGAPDAQERSFSGTDANQVWIKIDSDWTPALASETVISTTRFANDRNGVVDKPGQIIGEARDRRVLHMAGIRQHWRLELSERQVLSWGFESKEAEADYDYTSDVELLDVFATLEPGPPARETHHRLAPAGRSHGAWLSDRVRITDRVVTDIGARWDKQTYLPGDTDDEQFSPRWSLLYRAGAKTDVRLSYGRFFQPEGLLDLQVEDGVTDFSAPQDASHAIAGVEHRFDNDITLRAELFRKITRNARPRYENLFDLFVVLPELRPGRVRIAPQRGESRGAELFVSGEKPVSWWAAYTLSEADDIIDGRRVPRSWDQRQSVSGGLTWHAGAWTFGANVTYHSGWPTTELDLETVTAPGGSEPLVVVPRERNAERLAPYRRLDFTASKVFRTSLGSVKFFAEVTNLTDRSNPCCADYKLIPRPDGSQTLERNEDDWLGRAANIGMRWEF